MEDLEANVDCESKSDQRIKDSKTEVAENPDGDTKDCENGDAQNENNSPKYTLAERACICIIHTLGMIIVILIPCCRINGFAEITGELLIPICVLLIFFIGWAIGEAFAALK